MNLTTTSLSALFRLAGAVGSNDFHPLGESKLHAPAAVSGKYLALNCPP